MTGKGGGDHIAIDVKQEFVDALISKKGSDYQGEWERLKIKERQKCTKWMKLKDDPRNRYRNIGCNDNNIVKVKGVEYFNGNYIKDAAGKKLFIATQGPTFESSKDFWKVVVEEKVAVIVMLCGLFEKVEEPETGKLEMKEKCALYWPIDEPMKFGQYEIRRKSIREELFADGKEAMVITKLAVVHVDSKELLQNVMHVQYKSWPDLGVPESTEAVMSIYQRFVKSTITDAPVLIHCSAGIGRTGAFIGGYYAYDLFKKSQLTSFEQAVKRLRGMRGHSIQTPEQFLYAYLLLVELIAADGVYDVRDAKRKIKKLLKVKKAKKEMKQ